LEEAEAAAKLELKKRREEEIKNAEWRAQRYRNMLEGNTTTDGHVVNWSAMPRSWNWR